jgi:hypothetical protein
MSSYGIPAQPVAPVGPILQDVACRKCGYNLRGLDANGRCPECGTAVGYSLQGDLLRFCDPTWVDTLHRGTRLFIWGIVIIIIGAVIGGAMKQAGVASIGGLATLAGWVMMTIGWWLMTEPDPSGLGEDQYGTARKIIRIALIVSVAAQALQLATPYIVTSYESLIAVSVVSFALGVVGIVGFFAQLNYLKKLALRIPDRQLSGRAHFLMYAISISYGVLIAVGLIAVFVIRQAATGGGSTSGLQSIGCFAAIVGVCVLVFGLMYLLLVEKMGKRFKEQARAARMSWAATNFAGPAGQM